MRLFRRAPTWNPCRSSALLSPFRGLPGAISRAGAQWGQRCPDLLVPTCSRPPAALGHAIRRVGQPWLGLNRINPGWQICRGCAHQRLELGVSQRLRLCRSSYLNQCRQGLRPGRHNSFRAVFRRRQGARAPAYGRGRHPALPAGVRHRMAWSWHHDSPSTRRMLQNV